MAEMQNQPPSPDSTDAGIDKQSVLDEIAKASQAQPSAPPVESVPPVAVPSPAPASSPPPAPAAPTPATGQLPSPPTVPQPKAPQADAQPEAPAVPGPPPPTGFLSDLHQHRRMISIMICLSIGALWLLLGIVSKKVIPFVLAAIFILPTLTGIFTSRDRFSSGPPKDQKS